MILNVLMIALPVLLVALLIIEKRRQRARAALAAHREQLAAEERYDELDEEIDDEIDEEVMISEESRGRQFLAFLKGRPTRHLSAGGVVAILHGLVGFVMIGFILFMVFRSAITDPVVRMVLMCTVGVAGVILFIAFFVKRAKQEQELLRPDKRS